MDRRVDHPVEGDLAPRQGQRGIFTRDLINTLRQRDLDEAASKLSAETGLAYRLSADGEHLSGVYACALKWPRASRISGRCSTSST